MQTPSARSAPSLSRLCLQPSHAQNRQVMSPQVTYSGLLVSGASGSEDLRGSRFRDPGQPSPGCGVATWGLCGPPPWPGARTRTPHPLEFLRESRLGPLAASKARRGAWDPCSSAQHSDFSESQALGSEAYFRKIKYRVKQRDESRSYFTLATQKLPFFSISAYIYPYFCPCIYT